MEETEVASCYSNESRPQDENTPCHVLEQLGMRYAHSAQWLQNLLYQL